MEGSRYGGRIYWAGARVLRRSQSLVEFYKGKIHMEAAVGLLEGALGGVEAT
jgi:hypothetical protein